MLTAEVETARWFEALLRSRGASPKQAANWVVAELFGALNRRARQRRQARSRRGRPRNCSHWWPTARSGTFAKQVFEIMLETGEAPREIVEARGLKQTSDTGAIDAEIDKILAANADKVASTRAARRSCSASSSARR